MKGWYYVTSPSATGTNVVALTINKRLNVTGTANMILGDGVLLTLGDGIHVPEGTALNIYCQENGTGGLTALGDTNNLAAIGGNNNENGGNITYSWRKHYCELL